MPIYVHTEHKKKFHFLLPNTDFCENNIYVSCAFPKEKLDGIWPNVPPVL